MKGTFEPGRCGKVPVLLARKRSCPWTRPNANAYRLLESLNIGPELGSGPDEVGELIFIDGAYPGNDYIGVHVYDDLSISLLQRQLNEQGSGLQLRWLSRGQVRTGQIRYGA